MKKSELVQLIEEALEDLKSPWRIPPSLYISNNKKSTLDLIVKSLKSLIFINSPKNQITSVKIGENDTLIIKTEFETITFKIIKIE